MIRSDPHLLRRILQNFCTNALRYTRKGRIVLGIRHVGDDVRIELWDTGPGIADEQLQRIFDEFHRVDGASPWGEQGLGLGLSICERIARILNHQLRVRSWPGHGSCFAIQVPRVRIRARDEASVPRRSMLVGDLRPQHVLCLDNEPSILEGMASLLTRWGMSCDLAANRTEAFDALLRRRPDLILIDFHLGTGPDGIEVLGELLKHCNPAPPAALITADASPELKQRARALGLPVLLKPVRPAALRALLSSFARRSGGPAPVLDETAKVEPATSEATGVD